MEEKNTDLQIRDIKKMKDKVETIVIVVAAIGDVLLMIIYFCEIFV